MDFCLSPIIYFSSEARASRFLGLIRDIYHTTYDNEPECRAYCWFREDTAGSKVVKGFEMYANNDALAVTHRSSTPYKTMRQQFAAEELGQFPELIFMSPISYGFLNRNDAAPAF